MKKLPLNRILPFALLFSGCVLPSAAYANTTHAADKKTTSEKNSDRRVAPPAESNLVGKRYVAMGSSFAAGPQLPPAKPSWPARCGQSQSNYPTLLAARFGMELIDRSCSGAKTEHILGPWNEVPAQIISITPDTRLVTITIGGNDLNYIGNLFSATCAFNAKAAATANTKLHPCGPIFIPKEADYVRDEAQLNAIVQRVKSAAPLARVAFVQYLTPLPRPGTLCASTPVSETDAAIVRDIGRRLSDITTRVAKAHDVILVEMDEASANHPPCDRVPWMIGSPQGYDGKQGLQWHLNKAGMEATAEGIGWELIKDGVRPLAPTSTPASTPRVQQKSTHQPAQRTTARRASAQRVSVQRAPTARTQPKANNSTSRKQNSYAAR